MSRPANKGQTVEGILLPAAQNVQLFITERLASRELTSEIVLELLDAACKEFRVRVLTSHLRLVFQQDRILTGKNMSKGFPGIVLTAIVGKLLNSSYDPSKRFYACSPRALFEQHIYPILHGKFGAPMGKSDPLNVAKNQNRIDESWAENKRPESAAVAAVKLVDWVSRAKRDALLGLLHSMLVVYLTLARLHAAGVPEFPHHPGLFDVHHFLMRLINREPAGGQTTQTVVGVLLETHHEFFGFQGTLDGGNDSVFATNTTSKKPGDLLERLASMVHIYEVTTKPVDDQRLRESYEAVVAYVKILKESVDAIEVTFLCDPEATTNCWTQLKMGSIPYSLLSLHDWSLAVLDRLGPTGRDLMLSKLRGVICHNDTTLAVKQAWRDLLKERDS